MHRRVNTSDANKSGSVEAGNNASRGQLLPDNNPTSLRNEVVKQQIGKLLRSRGKLSAQLVSIQKIGETNHLQSIRQQQGESGGRLRLETKQPSSRSRIEANSTSLSNKPQLQVGIGQSHLPASRGQARKTPSNRQMSSFMVN